jgi:hypothetical protein
VNLAPWEYLFIPFTAHEFHDLFWPIFAAALVLLIGQVVLYNVRTRQLHRFEPLVAMQEWLLWTGLVTFGLVLVEAVFRFYFLFVMVTLVVGLGTYVWVRFWYWPPQITVYNQQLRRARFFSQERYKHPEATIRTRRRRRRH